MARVNDAMGSDGPRTAHFVCALTLAWPDGHVESVEGRVDGRLIWPPRGENGFGYDPIFFVPEHQCSAAELPAEIKNTISHRGRALLKLRELLHARQP